MAETGFRKKEGLTFKDSGAPLSGPLLLAAIGGILQTLSWPWPGLWHLCFLCLAPLIIASDGQSGRRAFLLGWVYGLAQSFSSLPWLAEVLSGYGGLGPALGWLILGLLVLYLALYPAFFAWLTTICVPSPMLWAILGAAAWGGLDWLKNWVFTGFNWTPLAGPLALSTEMGQAADIFGFYGLGFFVALVNFFLAVVFFESREGRKGRARLYLAAVAALIVGAFAYGNYQFKYWDEAADRGETKIVAAVQPSTDQVIKWDEDYRQKLLTRYEMLAQEAGRLNPWLTLWPETAMPFIFDLDFEESEWLRRLTAQNGEQTLVGIAGVSGHWPEQKLHNRLIFFQNGQPRDWYDKRHLVPFGEYLPLDWLPFLNWAFMQGLIGAAGTYSPGPKRLPIEVLLDPQNPGGRKIRLGVMICFESTFPYIGRDRVLEGAELLVVPTNDGWFGRSRAPEQHLLQASMRSIETRRPLIRAGNTGISAVVHPNGDIVGASALYDVGAFPLETPLLKSEDLRQTPFVRWGHRLPPFLAALTGLLALIRFFRKQK